MYTLDTNIIIYYLKGEPKIVRFLNKEILNGSRFFISSITEIELLSYPKISSEELFKIEEVLKTLSIIPVDSQVARFSGFLKRKYNISLPDSVIATTAYLTNSKLLTRNVKDFKKLKGFSIQSI